MTRKRLVAGNWKMNGSLGTNVPLVSGILAGAALAAHVDLAVCPPAVYLESVGQKLRGSAVALGAQNLCEREKPGAFTGEIHGSMLRELGCTYVIVGHSERRTLYGEDDARVAYKFATAQALGLTPILCLGETLEQRDAGEAERVLARQLGAVIDRNGVAAFARAALAYEPIWAIGTGRTASPDQAQAVHAFLRGELTRRDAKIANSVRILYGGSVKPTNAAALFACPDIDGGLIGGASLNPADFLAIAAAGRPTE
ncbi:MAG TPA: triose-phosphate isomerase [Nevskiaceae bacterium]|nr:triose-phosphate isomerase [Nevskiaceae bacterium]